MASLKGILGGFNKLFKQLDNLHADNLKKTEENNRALDWHVEQMKKHSDNNSELYAENNKICNIQNNVNDLLAGSLK